MKFIQIVIAANIWLGSEAFVPCINSERTERATKLMVGNDATQNLPKMSTSIPFLRRPAVLTGELAGDVGFDPLGLAKNRESLFEYREAEMKHARLAMLVRNTSN